MRRPIATRAAARKQLTIAFNATDEVMRAAAGDSQHKLLPPTAIPHVAQGRSHLRAALAELNHHSPNKK